MSSFEPGCNEVLARLDEHADGTLERELAEVVARHVENCEACAAELRLAERIAIELRALPEVDAPGSVLHVVRTVARAEARERRPAGLWRRLAWAGAAGAALAAAVLLAPRPVPTPEPAPVTDAQLAQAIDETELALTYLGRVGRRVAIRVRDDALRDHAVTPAARSVTRVLGAVPAVAPPQVQTTRVPPAERS